MVLYSNLRRYQYFNVPDWSGGRYASPVGPIRLDVAVPLNPRNVDNAFEFYISIGQAF